MNMQRPWNWNCCCCEVGNCCGWSKMDVYLGEDAGDDDKRIGRARRGHQNSRASGARLMRSECVSPARAEERLRTPVEQK